MSNGTSTMNAAASRNTLWKIAFLSGIAACIVSAIVAFGTSLFTTVLTVSTLFIGILNALLGASPAGKDENWFVSRARNVLNVSTLLKAATIGVWTTAVAFFGYGFLQARHEAQLITVEGYVLTAGGQPAANAMVTLLTSVKKEMVTGPDGKFTFTKVDLSREPSKQIKLEATWGQLSTAETVNFSEGPPGSLRITLPVGAPPFRVRYRFVEGLAIDLLLRGKLDPKWDEALGARKAIIRNAVYSRLQDLTRKFSTKPPGDDEYEYYSINTRSETREDSSVAKRLSGSPVFAGDAGRETWAPATKDDLLSITNKKKEWNAEVNPDQAATSTPRDSVFFWRFANRDDVARLAADQTTAFYNYVTTNNMPGDFCLVTLEQGACAGWGLNLSMRSLRVRVAVIENISSGPILFENFAVKESSTESLRDRETENSAQAVQASINKNLYAIEMVPGERIEIPVELSLAYGVSGEESKQPSPELRNKAAEQLSQTAEFRFESGGEPIKLNATEIVAMLNRPSVNQQLAKEFIFGPSVKIESVKVNGVNYPFREFDSNALAITGESAVGSCPSIYAFDAELDRWVKEGTILDGRVGKLKESMDAKKLKRFDGRLVIKEEDPEVSFIDFLVVRVIALDGREFFLLPDNPKLQFRDGNYLRLRRGDQLMVRFETPPVSLSAVYNAVATGYYVPFKDNVVTNARR